MSFSPNSISGLELWLDASNASSFSYNSGTNVSQWRDLAKNNHFNQVNVANMPIRTSIAGRQGVYFNVNSKQLVSANNNATIGNTARTLFVIGFAPNTSSILRLGTGGHSVATPANSFGIDNNCLNSVLWSPYVYNAFDNRWDTTRNQLFTIFHAQYDSSNGIISGEYNFNSKTTTPGTLNTTANPWYMGLRPDGGGSVDSYVFEVLHYSRVLTPSEKSNVEGYLAWKWGIQSSLPSSHAYKLTAPLSSYGFNPNFINNLSIWFDPTDTNSYSISSGNFINSLTSKQTRTNVTLTQPNTNRQPQIASNIQNGLSTLRTVNPNSTVVNLFNSNLESSNFNSSSICIFVIHNSTHTQNSIFGYLPSDPNSATRISTHSPWPNDIVYWDWRGNRLEHYLGGNGANTYVSEGFKIECYYVSGSTMGYRKNGNTLKTQAVTNLGSLAPFNSTHTFTLGSLIFDSVDYAYHKTDIGDFVCYNSGLSLTEIENMEGYLAWKWGLQSKLAVSHPYYSATSTLTVAAPTNVIAIPGNTQATVSWNIPAGTKTSYTITANPGGATKVVAGDISSTIFYDLSNGTTYTFTVTTNNAVNSSSPSAPSNAIIPYFSVDYSPYKVGLHTYATAFIDSSGNFNYAGYLNENAAFSNKPTPQRVTITGKKIKQTALGRATACVLTTDGLCYYLGVNATIWTQISITGADAGVKIADIGVGSYLPSAEPLPVTDDSRNHYLLVLENGNVYGFGRNSNGQLGDGTTNNVTPSAPVKMNLPAGVLAVTAIGGTNFSYIIDNTGGLWGVGLNSSTNGFFTDTSSGNVLTPVSCIKNSLLNRRVIAVTSLGLVLCSDNTLHTIGLGIRNGYGGNLTQHTQLNFTQLSGKIIKSIGSSNYHNYVLCTDGTLFVFGRGTTITNVTATILTGLTGVSINNAMIYYGIFNDSNYNTASEGTDEYNICGILSNRTVVNYGKNVMGEAGVGTTSTARTTRTFGTTNLVNYIYNSTELFFNWIVQNTISTTGSDEVSQSRVIGCDLSGNVYGVYWTTGAMTGQTFVGGLGDLVAFKLNSSGTILWRVQNTISWTGGEYLAAGTVDRQGNFIFGSIIADSDFIQGSTSSGKNDVAIFKLDSNGNKLWSRQTGNFNQSEQDFYPSFGTDNSGNVYMAHENATAGQIRISKHDTSGTFKWMSQSNTIINSSGLNQRPNIAIAGNGDIYCSYHTTGTISGQSRASLGLDNAVKIVVCKLNSDGSGVWIRQASSFNGSGDNFYSRICLDNSGNMYGIHHTIGALAGSINSGINDIIYYKLDSSGNTVWARQLSSLNSSVSETLGDICYNSKYDSVIIVYKTDGNVNNSPNNGGSDVVLARINPFNGSLNYVHQWSAFNTTGNVEHPSVASNPDGDVFVSYHTNVATQGNTASGNDMVVFKMSSEYPTNTSNITPSAPLSLVVSSTSNQTLTISWGMPSSDGGSTITGYRIESSTDNSTWFVDTSSNLTTYTKTDLTNGTTYYFRVSAINVNGIGTSATVSGSPSTLPNQPSPQIVGVTATSIDISWNAPSNGGSVITGYYIERSLDNITWTVDVSSHPNTNYSATGLNRGAIYYFRVSAINAAGRGIPSSSISAITISVPNPPTITSIAGGHNSASIFFDQSRNILPKITQYRYTFDGGVTFVTRPVNQTLSPWFVPNLTNGITYQFRIAAYNSNGWSNLSNMISVTPSDNRSTTFKNSITSVTANNLSTVTSTILSELTSKTINEARQLIFNMAQDISGQSAEVKKGLLLTSSNKINSTNNVIKSDINQQLIEFGVQKNVPFDISNQTVINQIIDISSFKVPTWNPSNLSVIVPDDDDDVLVAKLDISNILLTIVPDKTYTFSATYNDISSLNYYTIEYKRTDASRYMIIDSSSYLYLGESLVFSFPNGINRNFTFNIFGNPGGEAGAGTSGGFGDPKIFTIYNDSYYLPSNEGYYLLYDNQNINERIVITAKCWFLPENIKNNSYFKTSMLDTKTFFKYINIHYKGENITFDMETLEPVKYTNMNDVDTFNLQSTTEYPSIMNLSKVFNDSLVFRNFYRNIKIKMNNVIFNGKSRIIKLGNNYEFKLSHDLNCVDHRNGISLTRAIYSNAIGALIRENPDNEINYLILHKERCYLLFDNEITNKKLVITAKSWYLPENVKANSYFRNNIMEGKEFIKYLNIHYLGENLTIDMETLNIVEYTNELNLYNNTLPVSNNKPVNMFLTEIYDNVEALRQFYKNIKIQMYNIQFNGKSRSISLDGQYKINLSLDLNCSDHRNSITLECNDNITLLDKLNRPVDKLIL